MAKDERCENSQKNKQYSLWICSYMHIVHISSCLQRMDGHFVRTLWHIHGELCKISHRRLSVATCSQSRTHTWTLIRSFPDLWQCKLFTFVILGTRFSRARARFHAASQSALRENRAESWIGSGQRTARKSIRIWSLWLNSMAAEKN